MGRHTKLGEGDEAPDELPQRRNWVRLLVSVPLLPVVALVIAIGIVAYAFGTSQISLNFAGPPPQSQQRADAQESPVSQRGSGDRASRGTPRPTGAVIAFRVTRRLPKGFAGTATITNRGGQPINGWLLGFKIPNTRVLSLANAVVVKKGRVAWVKSPAQAPPLRPGHSVRVVFIAQGPVGKPSVCKFNRLACSLV